MNEIINAVSGGELALLEGLAKEAQYYSSTAVNSMLQLGRVLCKAKQLVKHGEWGAWIRENAGCSERTAQQFMQAYGRFGSSEAAAQIGDKSKLFKMLSLPAGTEDEFLAENDVAAMTSREVEEAVHKVREEMGVELSKEKKARQRAEERAEELERQADKIPDRVMDDLVAKQNTIDRQRMEIERVANDGRAALQEASRLRRENASLQRDVAERDEMLAEAQQDYDRVQADLLSMQSAASKCDAERVPVDALTLDVFASAVRQFVGTCARMPHMQHTFGTMLLAEKNDYDELLRTVEAWARDARKALDTVTIEEVEIHG